MQAAVVEKGLRSYGCHVNTMAATETLWHRQHAAGFHGIAVWEPHRSLPVPTSSPPSLPPSHQANLPPSCLPCAMQLGAPRALL